MKLHRTTAGVFAERDGRFVQLRETWDELLARAELRAHLAAQLDRSDVVAALPGRPLAPIGRQEVWAAGVTYERSRDARVEESRDAGGDSFYDRVYDAPRPELFFKAAPWRVRGPGDAVRLRRDARWTVPEPEIALVVDARGAIVGCTIGNDMSARDIEGENPLYLSQAKIYDGACALGPALLLVDRLPAETTIALRVVRDGRTALDACTTWGRMRREPSALVEHLYRETSFPDGCVLLTGTGIVPPSDFTLAPGDEITIDVEHVGTLSNVVDTR